MSTRKQLSGFTLVELLIVIAIIGILAAIANPIYADYARKANRAAAKAEMMDVGNQEQQYFLVNRQYGDATTDPAYTYSFSSKVTSNYTTSIAANNASTPPSYTITLTPIANTTQASDGTLIVKSDGTKTRGGSSANW